jgi:hypothetical protein
VERGAVDKRDGAGWAATAARRFVVPCPIGWFLNRNVEMLLSAPADRIIRPGKD